MKGEKGQVPISLLIQVFIATLIIAAVLMAAHLILCTTSEAPVIGWIISFITGGKKLETVVPDMLVGIIGACQNLVAWALNPKNIAGVGVTELARDVGWGFIRDLANIFLVLGLIVISLAIILGIREYEAKKTLPILIAIALLINFTPVICGWIVDFSNKLIGHLVTQNVGGKFVEEVTARFREENIRDQLFFLFVLFYFTICAILTYLFYFLLFLLRFVFLLILTILSPIAFASKVFGPSDKIKKFFPSFLHWDQWWATFLEWCTIGLFGAFFIYVANNLMVMADNLGGNTPSGNLSLLGKLIIYFLPILLLLIGFFVTFDAAKGTLSAIAGAAALLTGIGAMTLVPMWRGVKGGIRGMIPKRVRRAFGERIKKPILGGFERVAKAPPTSPLEWGKGGGRLKRWTGRIVGAAAVPVWYLGGKVGEAGLKFLKEKPRIEISKAKLEAEKIEIPEILISKIREAIALGDWSNAAGYLSKAIERGGEFKEAVTRELKPEEVAEIGKRANELGAKAEAGRIARGFIDKLSDKQLKEMGFKTFEDRIIGEAKEDEIKDFAEGFWKTREAMTAIHEFWGGSQLRKAAQEFGREFVDEYMADIEARLREIRALPDEEAEKEYKAFIHANPKRARFLETVPAKDLGYTSLWELAPEVIKRKYKNIREILAEKPEKESEEKKSSFSS